MAKTSRAAPWSNQQPWSNDKGLLNTPSQQFINDLYNEVLAPNSAVQRVNKVTQNDSTATDNLDGTIAGAEAAITQLQNDFNLLLGTLRG
jgi:hypothetical protein